MLDENLLLGESLTSRLLGLLRLAVFIEFHDRGPDVVLERRMKLSGHGIEVEGVQGLEKGAGDGVKGGRHGIVVLVGAGWVVAVVGGRRKERRRRGEGGKRGEVIAAAKHCEGERGRERAS